jgi:6,7-dimethyl-8-ribityllumazine synthase
MDRLVARVGALNFAGSCGKRRGAVNPPLFTRALLVKCCGSFCEGEMPNIIEGHMTVRKGAKFAIVVSRWNSLITERLLEGALDCLLRHGGEEKNITVVRVPGAYELPVAAQALCKSKDYAGIIALGCVIRGSTPHFDYVAGEAAKGLTSAGMSSGIPIAFGLLTCDSLEQALERAGSKGGNKGWEAASSAVEMADLLGKIK